MVYATPLGVNKSILKKIIIIRGRVSIFVYLSVYVLPFQQVQSGIYYEVALLEKENRLKFHTQGEFPESLRTLVRPGHHILIDAGVTVRNLIAQQFSMTGTIHIS